MTNTASPGNAGGHKASKRPTAFEIPPPIPGFYSKPQVLALTSLSGTGLWRLVRDGLFPAPKKLSARRVGWSRQAVHLWIEEKMEAADASS